MAITQQKILSFAIRKVRWLVSREVIAILCKAEVKGLINRKQRDFLVKAVCDKVTPGEANMEKVYTVPAEVFLSFRGCSKADVEAKLMSTAGKSVEITECLSELGASGMMVVFGRCTEVPDFPKLLREE